MRREGTLPPWRRPRRVGRSPLLRLLLLAAVPSAACNGTKSTSGATPAGTMTLAWAPGAAESANGMPPKVTAAGACGSDKATFLAELLTTSPFEAKVMKEWADCEPGGKQIMISGTVADEHMGPTDLPTDHPFGDDLSMDITLDPAFVPFALNLGTTVGETTPGEMHVEISSGYIPHLRRPASPPAGQTWRAASDNNLDLTSFQPGFALPAVGDRIAIMGRWIIDCGHPDYGAELHAMSFLAWAHTEGNKTTLRTYFNPYRDLEVFTTDPSILGTVNDQARLGSARFLPPFLISQITAINDGTADRIRALELVEATNASPAAFVVCPPAGTSGSALSLGYDVVRRSGVTFTPASNPTTGCVTVTAGLESSYAPANAAMRECVLPWAYLNKIAGQRVGNSKVNLQSYLAPYVTSAAGKKALAQDPETACADALAGPTVSATPTGQSLRTDDTQPFPFYGVITVEWTGS